MTFYYILSADEKTTSIQTLETGLVQTQLINRSYHVETILTSIYFDILIVIVNKTMVQALLT